MLDNINKEIKECKDNILLKETLEEKLKTLEELYYKKNKVLGRLKESLDKEYSDVEKLNKLSLDNILSTIFNYKEKKLEKEEQEYLEAKIKYDEYKVIVEGLKNDLEYTKSRINSIGDYEEKYEDLINKKTKLLKGMNSNLKLEEIETSINMLTKEGIEIREAIEESVKCSFNVNSALKYLKDASSFATWDTLGGGGLVSMMKHDNVNSAKRELDRLGYAITKLDKELRDVNMGSMFKDFANIKSSYIVDIFFDNIFTDISVGNKIDSALGKIRILKERLMDCQQNLYNKERVNKNRINALRTEYEDIVENYR